MKYFLPLVLFFPLVLTAQKKPLDHTVYDGWQSIGEHLISNNGKWVVYTVTPQEGDAALFVQSTDGSGYKKEISRGYNALITEDNRFVVFKIKPWYSDTREAKIKKKKPEEMPKDSIGILELGKDSVIKSAKIKSYQTPEKGFGWVAYQKEAAPAKGPLAATQKAVDSLRRTIDSLTLLVTELKNIKAGVGDAVDAIDEPGAGSNKIKASDLVLRNLLNGKEQVFPNVVDYVFSDYGQKLVMSVAAPADDSVGASAVLLYDLAHWQVDTILKNGNEFRNFVFTDDGSKLAFVAERDTNRKALQKFYDLYLYREGADSAIILMSRFSEGMMLGMTISENAKLSFSKSGNRLLFGTAPIPPTKDTSLIGIDLVKLDIWNYKDDYLQTQQLSRLSSDLKRNYAAVFDFTAGEMHQLGSEGLPTVIPTKEGDGDYFVAVTDTGRRVAAQWTGSTRKDVYAIDVRTGKRTLVKKNLDGQVYASSTGKYILLYDNKSRNYFAWNGKTLKNISSSIKVPLYNELNDVPDDPRPYGIMGWQEGDSAVYIYDRYDVWKVDPTGKIAPVNFTRSGRRLKDTYRYLPVDPDEKFLRANQQVFFRVQNFTTKEMSIRYGRLDQQFIPMIFAGGKNAFAYFGKAKDSNSFLYSKESYSQSPDLYFSRGVVPEGSHTGAKRVDADERVTALNPQQPQYNWGTAELFRWKAYDGKAAKGILYKPEDFDPAKKYPMIIYFYERLSDGLYNYMAPEPTRSRLNIPFFVSRGYLVFAPDIAYSKGHPGKSAYNYVVSGAKALSKYKWVDSKNIGIQGQSWGGYQVAYLVTATNMFKAAWSGAPVVNMFSAYGGIRWESGNNRQSQYEKGQSRIGFTPWQRPDLYIENSPLFHLNKVNTPLVIMSNDADGAVPWYQGIEFFTALRRLGKKVWLLNYNGEAHNLVERKNKKDIQIREQQYFDWLLKGDKPPKWITEGVPAVRKGADWGLELQDRLP